MSTIHIKEASVQVATALDYTSNAVVIPMLLKGTYTKSFIKSFTDKSEFVKELADIHFIINEKDEVNYTLVKLLIDLGLEVIVYGYATGWGGIEGEAAYIDQLAGMSFEELKSKNLYNFKFLFSGYYRSKALEDTFANIAEIRGDAVAICGSGDVNQDGILADSSLVKASKYAAAFYPWLDVTIDKAEHKLPGSFAYLAAFANSVQVNPDWLAASGVSRGVIPFVFTPHFEVSEQLMHNLQKDKDAEASKYTGIPVNVIMKVSNYGYRVWGNAVTYRETNKSSYFDYLNVRVLLCDINKQIYHAALQTIFEPNDFVTWANFKSFNYDLLESMVSGRGIEWYAWKKLPVDEFGVIKANLTIKPIEAVEAFDITIYLTDQEEPEVEEAAEV